MIIPAGIASKKYAIKTAESTKEACKCVKLKALRRCGIKIGSRL